MKKTSLLAGALCLYGAVASAQCTDRVSHLHGSRVVAGSNVTVRPSGIVDSNTSYCVSTYPYFIGYIDQPDSRKGSFTISFSPPVSALTLNFSGLSNIGGNQEVVVLMVNGHHYVVPKTGDPNGCEPMGSLTLSGDITGCSGCAVSGWNGTTLSGPIDSISVIDTAISGGGNGSLFSLFICAPNSIPYQSMRQARLFPNPLTTETVLELAEPLNDAQLYLSNSLGQTLRQWNHLRGDRIPLKREDLPPGLYFIRLIENQQVLLSDKLVVLD